MKGKKVLIIDDSATIRSLVGNMLNKKGIQVFLAEEGWQGETVAREIKPDIILCDIEMPLRNGFETCKAIRQINELRDVPNIVLTTRKSQESFISAMASGADDYLLKPFKQDDLFHKLSKLLAQKTMRVFHGKSVLIIEDSKTIRNLISGMLERMAFKVYVAEDGSQGEAVANAVIPDMILCDLEMPVKNGYEFCESIRKNEKLKNVPVIVVSSHGGNTQRTRAINCGANDYLIKPFKENDMIEKLQKFFKPRAFLKN